MKEEVAWSATEQRHAMGSAWRICLLDSRPKEELESIINECWRYITWFEATFSRFTRDSLVHVLAGKKGTFDVPRALTEMLKVYEILDTLTDGVMNPFMGYTLSDLGYDRTYSLTPRDRVRQPPRWKDALEVNDATRITIKEPFQFDVGAVGKGYAVDVLGSILRKHEVQSFLIDGSGDLLIQHDTPLTIGLEDPDDTSCIIGTTTLSHGALCGSSGARRRWGSYHHTINPWTLVSPINTIATWVKAESAAIADGLCTALMLSCDIQKVQATFDCELLTLDEDRHIAVSLGICIVEKV